jgi:hypothetical protein
MTRIIKQKQVVAIYENSYEVVYTDPDPKKVIEYARANRTTLKRGGALKVITNTGFYEV